MAMDEQDLRLNPRKTEALFAGTRTHSERIAAGAAIERIKEKLSQDIKHSPHLQMDFFRNMK